MEAIIESNVGKCAFRISFTGLKPNDKLAEQFAQYHLWHKVQSLMFAGGKKAQFTKDSPYSPELASHALAKANAELGLYFEGLDIQISEEIKDSDEQKFVKFMVGLGSTAEIAKLAWKTAEEAKAKATQPAEVILK